MASTALVLLVLAGCSGGDTVAGGTPSPAPSVEPISATETSLASTSTTVPLTTTTGGEADLPPDTAVAGSATLGRGSKGAAVQAVEQRLSDLRFDPGKVDGSWDAATDQAVLSFQKQAGLPRTSKADEPTRMRLAGAPFGIPMVADGDAAREANRVEVDLERQVLQIWRDDKLYRVIGVSSGNNRKYCDRSVKTGKKVCGTAVTPTGMFHFERHIPGLRKSDLGTLYDPVYFTGGYAVHGSPSVPASPASHGCIRIPIRMSRWFFDNVTVGTQLYVLKGGTPPLPPSAAVDLPPTTTTTTLSPSTSSTVSTVSTTARPTTTTTRPVPTTTPTTIPATTTTSTAPSSTTTTRVLP